MILNESDLAPALLEFDISVVAVGYERRCRWATDKHRIVAGAGLGLTFGFLSDGSYSENYQYFDGKKFTFQVGVGPTAVDDAAKWFSGLNLGHLEIVRVFIDISSMSREMIANSILSLKRAFVGRSLHITCAYSPSKFEEPQPPAPIRAARPIKPSLSGWTSRPEQPLGAIFGVGYEVGMALGALQVLEPSKVWIFYPKGIDPRFDASLAEANEHIGDIFDISRSEYNITQPTISRGRFEALINAVGRDYRLITVPFGPKIFAWLTISTIVFSNRSDIGVWTFSSKEHAPLVDREAEGPVVWHNMVAVA